MWVSTVGAAIPLLAKRFGIDPALVSAPLISTLVDATRIGDLLQRRHRALDQAGGAGTN
jgi:Mg/Co/Ni transporter MgtE